MENHIEDKFETFMQNSLTSFPKIEAKEPNLHHSIIFEDQSVMIDTSFSIFDRSTDFLTCTKTNNSAPLDFDKERRLTNILKESKVLENSLPRILQSETPDHLKEITSNINEDQNGYPLKEADLTATSKEINSLVQTRKFFFHQKVNQIEEIIKEYDPDSSLQIAYCRPDSFDKKDIVVQIKTNNNPDENQIHEDNLDERPNRAIDNDNIPIPELENREADLINMNRSENVRNQDLESQIQQAQNIAASRSQNTSTLEEKKLKLEQILVKAAKFRFRRALVGSGTAFLVSLISLISLERPNTALRGIFLVCYAFLLYYLIENVKKTITRDILPWKRVENVYATFETASLFVFLLLVDLKIRGMIFPTKVYCFLPLVNLVTYSFLSKAPRSLKEIQIALKIIYTIQISLLCLKLDHDINWPWKAVSFFIWFFMGLTGLYFLLCLVSWIWITTSAVIFGKLQYEDVSKPVQIWGFLWATLYGGIGLLVFLGLLATCFMLDSQENSNRNFFKICHITMLSLSALVNLITIAYRKLILGYLANFSYEEGDYKAQLGIDATEVGMPEVKKKEEKVYLIKLSSTYFSFLNRGFSKKNKNNLARIEKIMQEKKLKRVRKARNHTHSVVQELDAAIVKFQKTNLQPKKVNRAVPEKERKIYLSCVKSNTNFRTQGEQISIVSSPIKNNLMKICYSEGNNLEAAEPKPFDTSNQEQNGNVCYICYDKAPNAVMVECGHGGVCFDCAVKVIKNQGLCMECREKVTKLVKINSCTNLKGIVKGYEEFVISTP